MPAPGTGREATQGQAGGLRATRVTTGVHWVQAPQAGLSILCGSPADVVKHLMLRGHIATENKGGTACETGPNVILLSDVLVQNGGFANLSEFPVLQMLYRQGMLLPGHPNNTGRKPMLIGSEAQVRAQLDYIYRGNYGLVWEGELREVGLDATEARRMMALKLRFAFGRIRGSEDLLDFRFIGKDPIDLGRGASVRRLALNRFQFALGAETCEVDLNLARGEAYEPPFGLGEHAVTPQRFSVIHCGEGDGWDLRRQSMASIVALDGRYYLVDAGPSILNTLRSLGIDLSEVEGIFQTHGHDDHFAGLPVLLNSGRRIKYFAAPMVRASVTKKLSALMSLDEGLFAQLFEVHDLALDQWNDCDGMQVMPMHSPHPVENTVFLFRMPDEIGDKTYAHWADIASMKVLKRLTTEAGAALPADYADKVRERYLTAATLKKIDAGGGLIHGEPEDFASDASKKIVLAHRAAAFSAEELKVGSQAEFGAVDVLLAPEQDHLMQRAYRHLLALFPDEDPASVASLLTAPITLHKAGTRIAARGAPATQVFLVITGSMELERAGQIPLALPCGSLLGVEAVFDAEPLAESWRATSAVRLLPIAVNDLRAFLLSGGWFQELRAALDASAFLRGTWLFGERLPVPRAGLLARAATPVRLAKGAPVPANALHVVRSGALVLKDARGRTLEIIEAGGVLGEEACLGRPAAPWQGTVLEDCELLAMESAALRAIPVVLWKLLEIHERRLRSMELRRTA